MRTHKYKAAPLWQSSALCGATGIYVMSASEWRKVTCKNCLRRKGRGRKK